MNLHHWRYQIILYSPIRHNRSDIIQLCLSLLALVLLVNLVGRRGSNPTGTQAAGSGRRDGKRGSDMEEGDTRSRDEKRRSRNGPKADDKDYGRIGDGIRVSSDDGNNGRGSDGKGNRGRLSDGNGSSGDGRGSARTGNRNRLNDGKDSNGKGSDGTGNRFIDSKSNDGRGSDDIGSGRRVINGTGTVGRPSDGKDNDRRGRDNDSRVSNRIGIVGRPSDGKGNDKRGRDNDSRVSNRTGTVGKPSDDNRNNGRGSDERGAGGRGTDSKHSKGKGIDGRGTYNRSSDSRDANLNGDCDGSLSDDNRGDNDKKVRASNGMGNKDNDVGIRISVADSSRGPKNGSDSNKSAASRDGNKSGRSSSSGKDDSKRGSGDANGYKDNYRGTCPGDGDKDYNARSRNEKGCSNGNRNAIQSKNRVEDESGGSPTEALRKKIQQLADSGIINSKDENDLINIALDINNEIDNLEHAANNAFSQSERDIYGQANYINDMEQEMQSMQQYYENETEKMKLNEEQLKCRCKALATELRAASSLAERSKRNQMEIDVLRNELRKRDVALNAYDTQYQQMMITIEALNKTRNNKLCNCSDVGIQTNEQLGHDLVYYTGATLDFIVKEVNKHAEDIRSIIATDDVQQRSLVPFGENDSNIFENEDGDSHRSFPPINSDRLSQNVNAFDDCVAELRRLKNLVESLEEQLEAKVKDCEQNRKELGKTKDELEHATTSLCEANDQHYKDMIKLKEKSEELEQLAKRLSDTEKNNEADYTKWKKRVDELEILNENECNELRKTVKELEKLNLYLCDAVEEHGKTIYEIGKKLTKIDKDIAKNGEDTNAMQKDLRKSIDRTTEDAQKLIDDLKNQLKDAQERGKLCEAENNAMAEELRKAGVDPEVIKQAVRKKFEEESIKGKSETSNEKTDGAGDSEKYSIGRIIDKGKDTTDRHGTAEKCTNLADAADRTKETKDGAGDPGGIEKGKEGAHSIDEDKAATDGPVNVKKGKEEDGGQGIKEEGEGASGPENNKSEADGTGCTFEGHERSDRSSSTPEGKEETDSPGSSKKDEENPCRRGNIDQGNDEAKDSHIPYTGFKTFKGLSTSSIDEERIEKDLRKIIDSFVEECGVCLCKCKVPKGRFYTICRRLYHFGLQTLDIKELVYIHRKIFTAAENIMPGCLFNIIVKDMQSVIKLPTLQQCCTCRNNLCCDEPEEKLMLKVIKLEHDIENAKVCLKKLRGLSFNQKPLIPSSVNRDCATDVFGATLNEEANASRIVRKRIKSLKARFVNWA